MTCEDKIGKRKVPKVAKPTRTSVKVPSSGIRGLNQHLKYRNAPRTASLFPDAFARDENPWGTNEINLRAASVSGGGPVALEVCAGAGGQALGFELAGISHASLIEIDKHACATLRLNRPRWDVIEQDLNKFNGSRFKGVDIVSGGLPCPPFSVAGKQLGRQDERNLFPAMLRLVDETRPTAVMIENVRGILDAVFEDYRDYIGTQLKRMGYQTGWNLLNAADFGVPQLRPRVVFIGVRKSHSHRFSWPAPLSSPPKTVGETIFDLMSKGKWRGATTWKKSADEIAPTIVGGSLKHGGPDLGPTRARRAWASLGVDGLGIADEPPKETFSGMPRLTVRMVARLQGFPDDWEFAGKKTQSYRQVGNAFPPPFARAIANKLVECLSASRSQVQIAG